MDTALLAKVQRAFIRRGLLHDDYEPGVWDAPTARAYVSYMRSRSIQRYPKQINLKDTLLIRDIVSVLSVRKTNGTIDPPESNVLTPTNLIASTPGTEEDAANSQWIDGGSLTEPEPPQDDAGDVIPPEPVPVVPESSESPPATTDSPDGSTRNKLLDIMNLLSKK